MATQIKFRERLFSATVVGNITELVNILTDLQVMKMHWIECRSLRGDTILHVASREGKFEVLKFLLDLQDGRDFVNFCNKDGKSPLHEAAACCSPESVQVLLDYGAEVNVVKIGDWTPLMLACTKMGQNAFDTVKILLYNGANPHVINKDGWTALHVASRTGNMEIVTLLIKEFPPLVTMKSFNGRYPVHTASLHGNYNIVTQLLGCNQEIVSKPDRCGTTPILEAARGDHARIMLLLIEYGATVTETDNMGMNCLHVAAQAASKNVIKLLVTDMHIDVNVMNKKFGMTSLHYAAKASHVDIIRELVMLGADPMLMDFSGRVALDFVARSPERQQILEIIKECVKP